MFRGDLHSQLKPGESTRRPGSAFGVLQENPHPSEPISLVRNSRLLRRLSPTALEEVFRLAVHRSYPPNEVIVEQNTRADRLFLLVKGSARYFFITPDGKKAYLLWLTPGDAFGAASLLAEQSEFLVSTETSSESHVLMWQRPTIRALASRYPTLLENGLSIASDYLVWYLATHLSLISDTARERLAHVLLSLARGIGRKHPKGISLDVTNEQLANTAHLTHFTVSRLMSRWQRNGALSKGRGRIILCHPELLFKHSNSSVSDGVKINSEKMRRQS